MGQERIDTVTTETEHQRKVAIATRITGIIAVGEALMLSSLAIPDAMPASELARWGVLSGGAAVGAYAVKRTREAIKASSAVAEADTEQTDEDSIAAQDETSLAPVTELPLPRIREEVEPILAA